MRFRHGVSWTTGARVSSLDSSAWCAGKSIEAGRLMVVRTLGAATWPSGLERGGPHEMRGCLMRSVTYCSYWFACLSGWRLQLSVSGECLARCAASVGLINTIRTFTGHEKFDNTIYRSGYRLVPISFIDQVYRRANLSCRGRAPFPERPLPPDWTKSHQYGLRPPDQ